MEYVILIVVIAVLALGGGGWLLFVRPRRGRAVTAPPGPHTGVWGTASASGSAGAADQSAGSATPTAAVLEVERPPPSAGRMVRLRA
ncbi:MAG TPA: signal recognition particle-docking protein FtsY, partial [Streptosporangiaceae bacterium]